MAVFAIMEGPDWGWSHPAILTLLVVSAVLLVGFVYTERRKPEPLIAVGLFADPTFSGCNLVIFSAQYTKMAVFVFGAMYLQDVLNMSPLMAGLPCCRRSLRKSSSPRFQATPPTGLVRAGPRCLASRPWASASPSWRSRSPGEAMP